MRKLLAFGLLIGLAVGSLCGFQQPQGGVTGTGSGTSITVTKCLTDGGGTLSSPYTIAVASSCPAGNWLVVAMSTRNNANTAGTLHDSKGNCSNAYTEHQASSWFITNAGMMIWDCLLTTGLTTSDHLTYTPTTDFSFSWQGISISGLTTGSDTFPTPTTNSSGSTNETTASFTMGHAPELVCGFISTNLASATVTSYNNLLGVAPTLTDSTAAFNNGWGSLGCRVVTGVTTGSWSITLPAASNAWVGQTFGYF